MPLGLSEFGRNSILLNSPEKNNCLKTTEEDASTYVCLRLKVSVLINVRVRIIWIGCYIPWYSVNTSHI